MPASARELHPPFDVATLRHIGAADEAETSIDGRVRVIVDVERQLRIGPSEIALRPELFDSSSPSRGAWTRAGCRPPGRAASTRRIGARTRTDRPDGFPRRTCADIEALLDAWCSATRSTRTRALCARRRSVACYASITTAVSPGAASSASG